MNQKYRGGSCNEMHHSVHMRRPDLPARNMVTAKGTGRRLIVDRGHNGDTSSSVKHTVQPIAIPVERVARSDSV